MNLRRDARHGLRIGRAEFSRSLRRYLGSTRRLLGLGFAVLFFGGNLLVALPAVYVLGQNARSITTIPYLGPTATLVPIGLVALAALRTLERIGRSDTEDLLLTTVHPRAVVVGLITAEVGRLAVWLGLPLAVVVVVFTLGLGSASLPVTVGLLAFPIICWAAVWGYAGGMAVLRVLRYLPTVRRALHVTGIVLLLGLIVASQFVGQYIAQEGLSVRSLLEVLTIAPLTDYIALAFIGTPLEQSISLGAFVVGGTLLVTTPVGLVVATRQASALWFTDTPARDEAAGEQELTSPGGFAAPRPFAWRKAGRIAWGLLVRGVRSPGEFGHLIMILFFLGPLGTMVVQSPSNALGPLAAGIGVGVGTYLAGAAFGLNPLGDDRSQLPLLLLTATRPRTLVRGRIIAGVTIGLPVAVLGALLSVALGMAVSDAIGFAVVGAGMCLAAALFAVGLGAMYPIYEEREFWGTETVVPSTLVMMGYLFVVGGGTVIGLLVTWYVISRNGLVSLSLAIGGSGYLLLTVGVSYASYRYAVRRYQRYTVD